MHYFLGLSVMCTQLPNKTLSPCVNVEKNASHGNARVSVVSVKVDTLKIIEA